MNLFLVPNKQMLPKGWGNYEDIPRGEWADKGVYEGVSPAEVFRGVNILQSYEYCDSFTEEVIIPFSKGFMLDSGAFTFFSKGKSGDWNEYIKKYASFINRNKIDLFFELDIDVLIGYEKVIYLRKKLEDMTGKPPIPVWHKSRGQAEFIKMCEEYKYVAFGGLNTDGVPPSKIVKYMPWFINKAHEHGAKIHGLGFTAMKELPNLHFDSVDSSTWSAGNRFGKVYYFNGSTIKTYSRKDGTRIADHQALALHNFKEWVKYAEYAEKYL